MNRLMQGIRQLVASPRALTLLLTSPLFALASCGESGGGAPTDPNPKPATQPAALSAATPAPATATVGEALTITVRVATAANAPVANASVTFSVLSGSGSVAAATVSTDASGQASTTWTLGTRVGENKLSASLGSLTPVEFVVSARAAAASALGISTQPAGARVGTAFATQPVVEVRDRYGNVVTDAAVNVTASLASGGGSLEGATSVSAARGAATFAGLVLKGPVGERTLRFTAPGLSEVTTNSFVLLPPARSEADRPDDVSGAQVHAIYVVPSDGVDRSLDVETAIHYTVASFQNWLAGKTGGRAIRMDTYMGALDVTFFRLSSTDAEVKSKGSFVATEVERQLREAGKLVPGKLYIIYYDGGSTWSCGGASWPPDVPGQVAVMYLKGTPPGANCADNRLAASPTQFPTYWEFAMLHDLLHALGIVAPNAPNHVLAGHVPEPHDLMYAGSAPWQLGAMTVVDVGGDDYFGPNVPAGVNSLSGSAFLTTIPVLAQMTPAPLAPSAGKVDFTRYPVHAPGEKAMHP
jgi:hypothetical protein